MPTNDQIILKQLLEDQKRELAPELSEADYFEVFCAEQALKNFDVSYDDIEEGIVGDGGDGGIDSIYTLINGEPIHEDTDLSIYRGDISIELHIIQSKKSYGFSEDTIHRFIASTSELLDLSDPLSHLAQTYNSKLVAIISKFREAFTRFTSKLPKLAIHYYYAALGAEVHPNVQRQVARLQETVKGLFSNADFTFDFLGARDLLGLARAQPSATHILKLAETPIAGDNSFICLVRLSDYREFITDEQGRYRRMIFDANVRDYQGDVEVNRAIRQTLLQPEGEDFWWLNNGITILATHASHSGKTLTIRDPRVVNGLQTSQEVFRAFQTSSVPSEDRSILVRVIMAESPASYQRIVRATNSQTNVPPASLRATDPIHRDIEDFLKAKGFYYERRKNCYKNDGRPRDKIISIPYLAQATMAILLGRADDARARPSTLIKSDQDYQTVFNSQYPMPAYFVCVTLMKRVETFLRSKGLVPKEVNNLKFHLAMFIARRALNMTAPSAARLAKLPLDQLDEAFVDSCFSEVNAVYVQLGAHDQASKGTEFVARLSQRLSELTYRKRLTE
jgi:hypothetical protein